MKMRPAFVIAFATLVFAPLVHAQEPALGESGHVALSVERLFGYSHVSNTFTSNGIDSNASADVISVLGNAGLAAYSIPRVAGDLFVAKNLSLGLAGVFLYVSTSQANSDSTGKLLQLVPRLGYVIQAGPRLAIWPRAGVTYERTWSSSARTSTTAVTLEAAFAVALLARVALLVVPFGDIGVGGSTHSNLIGSDIDRKATEFGFQLGMMVFL